MTVTSTILLQSRLPDLNATPGKGFELFYECFAADRTSSSRVPAQRILRVSRTWPQQVLSPIGDKFVCGSHIKKGVMSAR